MHHLIATLFTLAGTVRDRVQAAAGEDREAGNTIEIVFWAVALLALAGIVYAAILAYINNKIPGIR